MMFSIQKHKIQTNKKIENIILSRNCPVRRFYDIMHEQLCSQTHGKSTPKSQGDQ
jgi:hypothetical protein